MVEDHLMLRRALAALLEAHDIKVAGEGSTAAEGLELMRLLKPDLVTVDLQLPGQSGVDLLNEARRQALEIPALVVTSNFHQFKIQEALAAGARGYISKMADAPELLLAIRTVAAGGCYLQHDRPTLECKPPLSGRQSKILASLTRGRSNLQIAEELYLSVGTIKRELVLMCRVFGCSDRTSLVARAMSQNCL